MPTLILIRHGNHVPSKKAEDRDDVPDTEGMSREEKKKLEKQKDRNNPLDPKGEKEIEALKLFLHAVRVVPQLFLTSTYKHAIETAKDLDGDNTPVIPLKALTPHENVETFEEILAECSNKRLNYRAYDTIAIVGHEPRLSQLLTRLTSDRFRPFNRVEVAAVQAETWEALRLGRGMITFRYPVANYQEDKLQPKVQSKMQVAALLAGFTFTLLGSLVTSDKLPEHSWSLVVGYGLLTIGLFLFTASIYAYDQLSMPPGFWVSQTRAGKSNAISRWFWKTFNDNQSMHGPQYAYMVRTWNWLFTPAVITSFVGFILLVMSQKQTPFIQDLLWIIGAALIVVLLLYFWLRPKLGTD